MSVQARWSHVPGPPLHSVPLSLPMQQQQQTEGVVLQQPSQFSSHGHHVDTQSLAPPPPHRFSEPLPLSSFPSDKPAATCLPVTKSFQFPNELGGLANSSSSTVTVTPTQGQSSSGSTTGKTNDAAVQSGNSNNGSGQSVNNNNAIKNQQKNISGHHQYNNHSTGYGVSQKSGGSSGEWAHRRMGFHGRNHSLGAEKNFPNSKMKQVYVAKQTRSGPSTVA